MARKNCSEIGGQAVIEGVMMRGKTAEAVSVRDPYGKIQTESRRLPEKKPAVARIPVVRGVYSLVVSLVDGMRTLTRSGEVYGDDATEEAESKFEKFLAKHFKIDAVKLATVIGMTLGVLLAIALFVILPTYVKKGIFLLLDTSGIGVYWTILLENLTVGIVKIAVLLVYLLAISRMKEIKRLFMYHGAEHKTIACYEAGEPLTVENVRKHERIHDRCGTNFIFIVMIVSIVVNAVFFALLGWQPSRTIYEVLVRIAMLPVIAGVSYEVLKGLAKFDNIFTRVLKAPGRGLQKITTAEPDDSMIEVAVTAFEAVLKLESDKTAPTSEFVTYVKNSELLKSLEAVVGKTEAEIITMHFSGLSRRSEIDPKALVAKPVADKAKAAAEERKSGKPLQYILGTAPFYGYDFEVRPGVLIPRFDTEILAEETIKRIRERHSGERARVLELCTGSGAVAITIAKETGAEVTATDISGEAIAVAVRNAAKYGAEIEFIGGDLFAAAEGTFDFIVANPPYIPSGDIAELDGEVRDHEPVIALDGGADGLDFYRRIAAEYDSKLREGGALLMEVGAGEAEAVCAMFGGAETVYDYNTPPVARVVIVDKKPAVGSADDKAAIKE